MPPRLAEPQTGDGRPFERMGWDSVPGVRIERVCFNSPPIRHFLRQEPNGAGELLVKLAVFWTPVGDRHRR